MNIKCVECKNNFVGKTVTTKLCSDLCRQKRKKIIHKLYYQKNKGAFISRVIKSRMQPGVMALQRIWNQKWRDANPDKVKQIKIKSQRKINSTLLKVGKVTEEIRKTIYVRDSFTCLCCQSKAYLTIDHIKPISKGGLTELQNLQTLCRLCNSNKSQKDTDYRNLYQ